MERDVMPQPLESRAGAVMVATSDTLTGRAVRPGISASTWGSAATSAAKDGEDMVVAMNCERPAGSNWVFSMAACRLIESYSAAY